MTSTISGWRARPGWIEALTHIGTTVLFAALSCAVFSPSFSGEFVSDDLSDIVANPYLQSLDWDNIRILFAPFGPAPALTGNYEPIHLLAHAVEVALFREDTGPYHVVNAIVHGWVSALLVVVFLRTGLPRTFAFLGGAIFLVHPANVEVVGWISQLKSSMALALALVALILEPRRPLLAAGAFALALLSKPTAAFALPVVLLFAWSRVPRDDAAGASLGWRAIGWAGWALVLGFFAAAELHAFRSINTTVAPVHDDPLVVGRTVLANAGRYFGMTAGHGLSAFHGARPALSWLDPAFLGGLVAAALLTWRTIATLRRRSAEGAYWAWAAIGFAPVSQILPFIYPVADRYLYFMLPGLIGGSLFGLRSLLSLVPARRRRSTIAALLAVAFVGLGLFSQASWKRSALWSSFDLVQRDSARNYPDGIFAHLLRFDAAAESGDGERAAEALRAAFERGWIQLNLVFQHRHIRRVLDHPELRRTLSDMAQARIERIGALPVPSQGQLYLLGRAHRVRGESAAALRAFERALTAGGDLDARIEEQINQVRARLGEAPPDAQHHSNPEF